MDSEIRGIDKGCIEIMIVLYLCNNTFLGGMIAKQVTVVPHCMLFLCLWVLRGYPVSSYVDGLGLLV